MEKKLNLRQKLIVIFLDLIVLIELAVCLYWANRYGELMTPMFLKTYLPTIFVTLAIGKICIHKAQSKDANIETDISSQAIDNITKDSVRSEIGFSFLPVVNK
jgi:hypothetical protein